MSNTKKTLLIIACVVVAGAIALAAILLWPGQKKTSNPLSEETKVAVMAQGKDVAEAALKAFDPYREASLDYPEQPDVYMGGEGRLEAYRDIEEAYRKLQDHLRYTPRILEDLDSRGFREKKDEAIGAAEEFLRQAESAYASEFLKEPYRESSEAREEFRQELQEFEEIGT